MTATQTKPTKVTRGRFEMPKFEMPKFEVPTFDLGKFDLTKFDLSKLAMPKFEMPAVDTAALAKIDERVLGIARDVAYVTVGLGVVAVQQAQRSVAAVSGQLRRYAK